MDKTRANYIKEFNSKNYKTYIFRVKKSDQKVIEILDGISNRNRFITGLIEEALFPSVLTLKQIKEKIRPITTNHGIQNVYIFGSYSRGEATGNSDVDIYCDRGDVDTLWKHSAFVDELAEALGKDVDVITIGSHMDESFREQLEKDMIKLW